jgi:endonuclease-8
VPEGHTIHRLARDQAPDLVGRALRVTSPQGELGAQPAAREALAAARALDGRVLERIDAHGKHLLYRFAGAADVLHVHLGLFGRLRPFAAPGPAPRPTDRLLLAGPERVWRLAGATASRLLDPDGVRALLARLGPDPLRADADPGRAFAALGRRRVPVAQALLEQEVVAGVGNMYRAEVLWAVRLDPWRPARDVGPGEAERLWDEIVGQLRHGVEHPRGRARRGVYRRVDCRRCGGPVARRELAARTLWWCPACQRAPRPA